MSVVKEDMELVGVRGKDAEESVKWKQMIGRVDPWRNQPDYKKSVNWLCVGWGVLQWTEQRTNYVGRVCLSVFLSEDEHFKKYFLHVFVANAKQEFLSAFGSDNEAYLILLVPNCIQYPTKVNPIIYQLATKYKNLK